MTFATLNSPKQKKRTTLNPPQTQKKEQHWTPPKQKKMKTIKIAGGFVSPSIDKTFWLGSNRWSPMLWCKGWKQTWGIRDVSWSMGGITRWSSGGFKDFLFFTPNLGEMIQFDEHIFQMGWNHQLVLFRRIPWKKWCCWLYKWEGTMQLSSFFFNVQLHDEGVTKWQTKVFGKGLSSPLSFKFILCTKMLYRTGSGVDHDWVASEIQTWSPSLPQKSALQKGHLSNCNPRHSLVPPQRRRPCCMVFFCCSSCSSSSSSSSFLLSLLLSSQESKNMLAASSWQHQLCGDCSTIVRNWNSFLESWQQESFSSPRTLQNRFTRSSVSLSNQIGRRPQRLHRSKCLWLVKLSSKPGYLRGSFCKMIRLMDDSWKATFCVESWFAK